MKIFISYPPLTGKGSPMLTQNRQFQWYHVPSYIYPVVAAYAATLLDQDGFDVTWADGITQQWTYDQFLKQFEMERLDLVAVETKTPVVRQHWQIIRDLKERHPQTQVVLIGDHVTAFPKESLLQSQVDYVITGSHYDVTLLDMARHLRDGRPMPPGVWYRDGEAISNNRPLYPDVAADRLALAWQYLAFAKEMSLDSEFQGRQVISRGYYAMHHAARAVIFATRRQDVTSHEGVIKEISRILGQEDASILVGQLDLRNEVEYEVYLRSDTMKLAKESLVVATRFIENCIAYLERR